MLQKHRRSVIWRGASYTWCIAIIAQKKNYLKKQLPVKVIMWVFFLFVFRIVDF